MRAHRKLNSHAIDDRAENAGVLYQEGEPLRAGEKELERDRHRWELDPASSDDYPERARSPRKPNVKAHS